MELQRMKPEMGEEEIGAVHVNKFGFCRVLDLPGWNRFGRRGGVTKRLFTRSGTLSGLMSLLSQAGRGDEGEKQSKESSSFSDFAGWYCRRRREALPPARSGRLGVGREDGIGGSAPLHQNFIAASPGIFQHTFGRPMEIVKFDPGSFQHTAQIMSCSIWNLRLCVILWNQGNINMIHTNILSLRGWTTDSLVTNIGEVLFAELKSYLHNSYKALMQIVGSASYTIEQDLFSKFSCTRLSWFDDKHGVDTVPVVRVDPPVVDDNAAVEVPQIQQRGPLSLSSVVDIPNL